jgi:hypothetical protein
MEVFLLNKEPYLTPELIKQLIDRINELKADELLEKEFNTKLRVAQPPEDRQLSFGEAIIERERKRSRHAS